jgi:hypothetical protein
VIEGLEMASINFNVAERPQPKEQRRIETKPPKGFPEQE